MRRLLALSLAAALCSAVSLPATGAAADGGSAPSGDAAISRMSTARSASPEAWKPVVYEDLDLPAGRYCTYALRSTVERQDVRSRVLDRYPDGAVRYEEFEGPLDVSYTNQDTGRSVQRDIGGRAYVEYRPDGTYRNYVAVGPVAIGIRPGDAFPQGWWVVDGVHLIEFAADGTRSFGARMGPEENICDTLAP